MRNWSVTIDATKKKTIDAKSVVSRDVTDIDDNNTLLLLQTKPDDIDEFGKIYSMNHHQYAALS